LWSELGVTRTRRGFQACIKDDLKLILAEVKAIKDPIKRKKCLAAVADVSEFLGIKGLEE
jgi:hypothetical protein